MAASVEPARMGRVFTTKGFWDCFTCYGNGGHCSAPDCVYEEHCPDPDCVGEELPLAYPQPSPPFPATCPEPSSFSPLVTCTQLSDVQQRLMALAGIGRMDAGGNEVDRDPCPHKDERVIIVNQYESHTEKTGHTQYKENTDIQMYKNCVDVSTIATGVAYAKTHLLGQALGTTDPSLPPAQPSPLLRRCNSGSLVHLRPFRATCLNPE